MESCSKDDDQLNIKLEYDEADLIIDTGPDMPEEDALKVEEHDDEDKPVNALQLTTPDAGETDSLDIIEVKPEESEDETLDIKSDDEEDTVNNSKPVLLLKTSEVQKAAKQDNQFHITDTQSEINKNTPDKFVRFCQICGKKLNFVVHNNNDGCITLMPTCHSCSVANTVIQTCSSLVTEAKRPSGPFQICNKSPSLTVPCTSEGKIKPQVGKVLKIVNRPSIPVCGTSAGRTGEVVKIMGEVCIRDLKCATNSNSNIQIPDLKKAARIMLVKNPPDNLLAKQVWKCWYCLKSFDSLSSCKEHQKSHLIFRCLPCGMTFKTKALYDCHMKESHQINSRETSNITKAVSILKPRKPAVAPAEIKPAVKEQDQGENQNTLIEVPGHESDQIKVKSESDQSSDHPTDEVKKDVEKCFKCGFCSKISRCCETFPVNCCMKEPKLTRKTNLQIFKCSICCEIFNEWKRFVKHAETCKSGTKVKEKLTCNVCEEMFNDWNCYRLHKKTCKLGTIKKPKPTTKPNLQILTCAICYKKFNEQNSYMVHVRECTGALKEACKPASEEFKFNTSKDNVSVQDNATAEVVESYNQKQGNLPTTDLDDLSDKEKEIKIYESELVKCIKCNICKKISVGYSETDILCKCDSKEESLINKKYFKPHEYPRPFKCGKCGLVFKTMCEYKVHFVRKHGEKASSAATSTKSTNYCNNEKEYVELQTFVKKEISEPLTEDQMDETSNINVTQESEKKAEVDDIVCYQMNEDTISVCEICNSSFTTMTEYVDHLLTHQTGEGDSFFCPDCQKECRNYAALYRHKMAHERRYQCKVCSKRFSFSGNLTDHMRIHTNTRPYVCEICGHASINQSHLVVHRRTHTGERPYVCNHENCGKAFASISSMYKHKATHSNVKKFKCNCCLKEFRQAEHLSRHLRSHINDRRYPCTLCSKKFFRAEHLKRHVDSIHNKGGGRCRRRSRKKKAEKSK